MKKNIGKFSITRELGEGATSVVYLGHDEFNDKYVAIKVAKKNILANHQNRKLQSMLLNEVTLAGRLNHPHIVNLIDAGIEDDDLYIVMEYVDGKVLKDYICADKRLDYNNFNDIIFKCCNALGYAAERGVIHRDIKPENIIVIPKPDGGFDVKVADFGASFSRQSDRSQIEGVVGTPAYISPEVLTGEKANHRADIYSLGVVMYQLLSGQLPFQGKNMAHMFQNILHEKETRLTEINPEIPAVYVDIVHRCLEKNPDDRFQSWSDLEIALVLAGQHLKQELYSNDAKGELNDIEKFMMLKGLKFFKDASDRELWEILSICYWYELPAGEVIVQDGDTGNTLYVLAKGTLKTLKNDRILGFIQPGYIIGEVAYIRGKSQRRTATVVSETDVIIIEIEPEDINKASDSLRSIIQGIMLKVLVERLDNVSILAASNRSEG